MGRPSDTNVAVASLAVVAVFALLLGRGGSVNTSHDAAPAANPTTTLSSTSSPTTAARPTTTTPARRYQESDPEFLAAALDKGSMSVSDTEIAPYARALDRAESKCHETRMHITDMAVTSLELLAEESTHSETLLSMLQALDQAIPPEAAPMSCAEVYALILVLMTSG